MIVRGLYETVRQRCAFAYCEIVYLLLQRARVDGTIEQFVINDIAMFKWDHARGTVVTTA